MSRCPTCEWIDGASLHPQYAADRRAGHTCNDHTVMGVTDWPEHGQKDFEIVDVLPGEPFDVAIERAKLLYSPDQKRYIVCYIVDDKGRRVYG